MSCGGSWYGSHGEVGSGVAGERWSRYRKSRFGGLGEPRLGNEGVARVMAGKAG